MRNNKIIHFLPALDEMGGTETMLDRTTPQLSNFTHVFVSAGTLGKFGMQLKKIHKTYSLNYHSFRDLPSSLSRLVNIIREEKPAVVTTYLIHADLVGRVAAKIAGNFKVVCFNRGSLLNWKYLRVFDFLTKFLVDHYLTNSVTQRRRLAQDLMIDNKKITVIQNGLDPVALRPTIAITKIKKLLKIKPGTFVIGYIGRLRHRKGLTTLIKAFAEISSRKNKLVIIGDGPQRHELETLAEKLGVSSNIIFTGTKNDVNNYYQILNLFVFPSHEEGMPNSLIEALATGQAIVCSDIPECREVVGKNAEYFKPGDYHLLASKLSKLINSPQRRAALKKEARARFQKYFTIDKTVAKLNQFYSGF